MSLFAPVWMLVIIVVGVKNSPSTETTMTRTYCTPALPVTCLICIQPYRTFQGGNQKFISWEGVFSPIPSPSSVSFLRSLFHSPARLEVAPKIQLRDLGVRC